MWTSKTSADAAKLTEANAEIARLRIEVEQWRSTAEEARRVAAGFEGEANALRCAVDLLRQIQADQRIAEVNAQLRDRVDELEAQLSQCLVRATTQPVTVTRDGTSRG